MTSGWVSAWSNAAAALGEAKMISRNVPAGGLSARSIEGGQAVASPDQHFGGGASRVAPAARAPARDLAARWLRAARADVADPGRGVADADHAGATVRVGTRPSVSRRRANGLQRVVPAGPPRREFRGPSHRVCGISLGPHHPGCRHRRPRRCPGPVPGPPSGPDHPDGSRCPPRIPSPGWSRAARMRRATVTRMVPLTRPGPAQPVRPG